MTKREAEGRLCDCAAKFAGEFLDWLNGLGEEGTKLVSPNLAYRAGELTGYCLESGRSFTIDGVKVPPYREDLDEEDTELDRVPCEVCDGTGRDAGNGRCSVCDGRGWNVVLRDCVKAGAA